MMFAIIVTAIIVFLVFCSSGSSNNANSANTDGAQPTQQPDVTADDFNIDLLGGDEDCDEQDYDDGNDIQDDDQ